jgi:hypothetical protein
LKYISHITLIIGLFVLITLMKIDFRYLEHQGLSIDLRKKYVLSFDPCTWGLIGIYDNYDEAFKSTSYPLYRKHTDIKGLVCNVNAFYVLQSMYENNKEILEHTQNTPLHYNGNIFFNK